MSGWHILGVGRPILAASRLSKPAGRAEKRVRSLKGCPTPLDVVIQRELVWVWAQADGVGLVAALVVDEGFDQLFGEYIALQEERVVVLQTPQRLFERC